MKIPEIKLPEGVGPKLVKAGLFIAALIWGTKALGKALDNAAQDKADSQIDTDPDAGNARALNAAMNPSGFDLIRDVDGTTTEAIYEVAKQIVSLDNVKGFYKDQTK